MRDQAAALSREEKKQVAEFLTRRTLVDADATSIKTMKNLCSVQRGLDQSALGWNGWSPAADGSRFQNAAAAGITAAQVPSLKLKWAFGLPQTASMFSQPTVAGGRLFFASDAGTLYSIDAETGCLLVISRRWQCAERSNCPTDQRAY
jgi:polyvinyl alcohol dehydrogenase (cytochrome)